MACFILEGTNVVGIQQSTMQQMAEDRQKRGSMKKLSLQNVFLIGVTLFSMFFGAGNLIFPPYLGYQAGGASLPAFFGFAITAVVFPVLGVTAVAKSGGLDHLCEKVHPSFSLIYSIAVYLCIGPMLAIPRTAGTSYSMFAFLTGRLGNGSFFGIPVQLLASILFSLVFFLAAGIVAKHPERLKDLLGKRMTPVLITLILVMFVAGLFHMSLPLSETADKYLSNPLGTGFVDGYQTMDTMAAVVFGIVIAINIRALGVTENKAVAAETIRGGIIAGILLATMYGMLTFLGAKSGSLVTGALNGTEILSAVCRSFFGEAGEIILALIFFIACFNVCVGLICSCAEFFADKFRALSFDQWRWVLTAWSFLISIAGLNMILAISSPILSVIYPVTIVIILMNLLPIPVLQTRFLQRLGVALALLYGLWSIL